MNLTFAIAPDDLQQCPSGPLPSPTLIHRFLGCSAGTVFAAVDASGIVVHCNAACATLVGRRVGALIGLPATALLTVDDAERVISWAAGRAVAPDQPTLLNFADASDRVFTLHAMAERVDGVAMVLAEPPLASDSPDPADWLELNNELATMAREHARTNRRLEAAIAELKDSHWHLKKIHEVLPICVECGRVKGFGSGWQEVVDFLRQSATFLSHGYCPECHDAYVKRHGLDGPEVVADDDHDQRGAPPRECFSAPSPRSGPGRRD